MTVAATATALVLLAGGATVAGAHGAGPPTFLTDGVASVEAAGLETPEAALATFARLLGDGEDALPEQASPRARAALYRNCVRIAERHGLAHDCAEPADLDEHPGRGAGPPDDRGGPPEDVRGHGPGGRPEGHTGPPDHAPGWGPGGRPDDHEGPPPDVPAHDRRRPSADEDS